MKLELKKLKVSQSLSEETLAFTADLYADGVLVAHVSNRGNGGCHCYHWAKPTLAGKVIAYAVKQLPEHDFEQLDWLIGDMITAVDVRKQLVRAAKTKTLIRKPGDPLDEWREIKMVFIPEIKSALIGRYGPGIVILNEDIEGAVAIIVKGINERDKAKVTAFSK